MKSEIHCSMSPVSLSRVGVKDIFWAPRQEVNRKVTIPSLFEYCKKTGRIDAFRLNWKPGKPNPPHRFWDSDVAKWLEASSYALVTHPDKELERQLDEVIDIIAGAQLDDGYLNTRFTTVEPESRWSNLRDNHELYCAGHLMEAATAYYDATGKRSLLDIMCRYADYIDSVFGKAPGRKRGYPGHEEIELALAKLFKATKKTRYLDLAKFFIDERGRQPHYFSQEALARGEEPGNGLTWPWSIGHQYDYWQAHLPVREQTTAEGHAVRAMYLFSGMADVAAETGDLSLFKACKVLWRNMTERRMYITGALGSSSEGERFTFDYELPNDTAYSETCAAIGLVFWAHRMLQIECDGQYADVMERALYNGAISGVSLKGDTFFYANPLDVNPCSSYFSKRERIKPYRQESFDTNCCPPNIARLIASLGQYIYAESETAAVVHLYVESSAELQVGGQKVELHQETRYPWDGSVKVTVLPEQPADFTIKLRLPGWCPKAILSVNGDLVPPQANKGYLLIHRTWQSGDEVALEMEMPIQRVYAHPKVSTNVGRVALQRGPIVYCAEELDNDSSPSALVLPRDGEMEATFEENLLGGVVTISGSALKLQDSDWQEQLYRAHSPQFVPAIIKAVPFCTWCNREAGEMVVWLREG